MTYEGQAVIRRGRGINNILAGLMRLPKSGDSVPVRVEINCLNGSERWRRIFGNSVLETVLTRADNQKRGCFFEQFGPIRFDIYVEVIEDRLHWDLVGWSLYGIRLPRYLTPLSRTVEYVDDEGRYCFDIDLELRFLGRLIAYKGWLISEVSA